MRKRHDANKSPYDGKSCLKSAKFAMQQKEHRPMTTWPRHATWKGPIVMIGFGSIGRGTLPLLLRHLDLDRSRFTVIDPDDSNRKLVENEGLAFVKQAVTKK